MAEALAAFPFSTPALDSLARRILEIAAACVEGEDAPVLESAALLSHLQNERQTAQALRRLAVQGAPARLAAFLKAPRAEAAEAFTRRLEEMRRARELREELARAEAAFAEEQSEENLARLMQVRAELDALRLASE